MMFFHTCLSLDSVIHQHPEEEDVKPFTSFFIHYYTSKMLTVDIPNPLLADNNVR